MGIGIEHIILISNSIVTAGLFIATLYRIKIEKKQIEVIIKNAVAAEKLRALRRIMEKEKSLINEMTGNEFIEFLKQVVNDEN